MDASGEKAKRGAVGPTDSAVRRLYVKRAAFDDVEPAGTSNHGVRAAHVEVRLSVRNRTVRIDAQTYEAVLELEVQGQVAGRDVYHATVHQAGVFDLPAGVSGAARRRLLNVDCSRALFAPAWSAVMDLVGAGGFPVLSQPKVDFDALYAARQGADAKSTDVLEVEHFWKALTRLYAMFPAGREASGAANFHPIWGEALSVAQMSRDALPAADRVLAAGPDKPETLEALSAVYSVNNVHLRAVEVYRRVVAAAPRDARARYNLAGSLVFAGDFDGASREIAACIALQPTFWEAYTVRSQLRQHHRPGDCIDNLESMLRQCGSDALAQERLHMALGVEYEDCGDYARAFQHFSKGKAAGMGGRHYDRREDDALFDAVARQAPVAGPAATGFATDEPIFVFGLPRSGTTLVGRILSSHPSVTSGGELKQLGMLLKYASGSRTPCVFDVDTVAHSRDIGWRALGERYLASTRPLSGRTPRFIDKFPHHFLYVGYIANALPRARMICVRRDPMDTCLANFREVFAHTSPFHRYAYDLLDIGHYYALFDRLMTHWRRSMPGRVLEVSYESLVADHEAAARTMLDFCGLDWDPACAAFERNRAPVATASAVQVRLPIYRHAIGRWKHYAAQLEPLRSQLMQSGIEMAAA